MNILIKSILLSAVVFSSSAYSAFISPDSASATSSNTFNTPTDLINEASDFSFIASSPVSGGGGTSHYTGSNNNTYTFNFDNDVTLDTLYLWDYYRHTPTNWIIQYFNASNTLLGTDIFNITPTAVEPDSALHVIALTSTASAISYVKLQNTNFSIGGGVGLAEIYFNTVDAVAVPVPEPSILALMGLGMITFGFSRRKTKALTV